MIDPELFCMVNTVKMCFVFSFWQKLPIFKVVWRFCWKTFKFVASQTWKPALSEETIMHTMFIMQLFFRLYQTCLSHMIFHAWYIHHAHFVYSFMIYLSCANNLFHEHVFFMHDIFFQVPGMLNFAWYVFRVCCGFELYVFPQQPERLGVLPIKLRGGSGRPKPCTRFREVPKEWNRFRREGSIHGTLGSEGFRSQGCMKR